MTITEMKEHTVSWKTKLDKVNDTFNFKFQNMGLEPIITVDCKCCGEQSRVRNEYTKYAWSRYNGVPTKKKNCSWFVTNLRLVIGTLAAGIGPSDVACLFSFLGLPKLHSFSKKVHQRIELLIGKELRDVADVSMDEAMELEVSETQKYKKFQDQQWSELVEPLGLTVSYDMGWSKRSSGSTYDSLSGHTFLIGAHSKKIVSTQVTSKVCSTCSAADGKGIEPIKHDCPRNYHGSSKAMETDAALSLVLKLDEKYKSKLYVEAFVTDDDASLRAAIAHKDPSKRNSKGKLPPHIPEPRWLADPSHRTRVVARAIFCLAAARLEVSECKKLMHIVLRNTLDTC